MGCCTIGYKYSGSCTPRNFLTKKEKIEMLTEYKESLEKEVQGITEKISKLEEQ